MVCRVPCRRDGRGPWPERKRDTDSEGGLTLGDVDVCMDHGVRRPHPDPRATTRTEPGPRTTGDEVDEGRTPPGAGQPGAHGTAARRLRLRRVV